MITTAAVVITISILIIDVISTNTTYWCFYHKFTSINHGKIEVRGLRTRLTMEQNLI